jgi:hypothetical protein
MFVLASLGFIAFARKFYTLRDIVYISIKDMGELIVLLALFDKVENKDEKLARILKLSPEEVKREIESGRIMYLISKKATEVLDSLKNSVPEVKQLLMPIEEDLLNWGILMEFPQNNFKIYAGVGIIFAIICLFFAGLVIIVGSATPDGYESICTLGSYGMSPSLEIALVQSGVFDPNPRVIYGIGKKLPHYTYDPKTFGIGTNWLLNFRMW